MLVRTTEKLPHNISLQPYIRVVFRPGCPEYERSILVLSNINLSLEDEIAWEATRIQDMVAFPVIKWTCETDEFAESFIVFVELLTVFYPYVSFPLITPTHK